MTQQDMAGFFQGSGPFPEEAALRQGVAQRRGAGALRRGARAKPSAWLGQEEELVTVELGGQYSGVYCYRK